MQLGRLATRAIGCDLGEGEMIDAGGQVKVAMFEDDGAVVFDLPLKWFVVSDNPFSV